MMGLRHWTSKHISEFTLFLLASATLLSLNILIRDFRYIQNLSLVSASFETKYRKPHAVQSGIVRAVVAGTSPSSSATTTINNGPKGVPGKTLAGGDEGKDVAALQEFLKSHGFLPADREISGYFGPGTENAVRKYQTSRGLEPTGRVGPLTREAWAKDLGSQ